MHFSSESVFPDPAFLQRRAQNLQCGAHDSGEDRGKGEGEGGRDRGVFFSFFYVLWRLPLRYIHVDGLPLQLHFLRRIVMHFLSGSVSPKPAFLQYKKVIMQWGGDRGLRCNRVMHGRSP